MQKPMMFLPKENDVSIRHPLLIIEDEKYNISVGAADDTRPGVEEAALPDYWHQLLQKTVAELVGAFLLLAFSGGSVFANYLSGGEISFLGISLASGATVMAVILCIGHISGAHLNPAVTIAFAAARQFPWLEVPFYLAGQFTGCILAALVLNIIFGPAAPPSLIVTKPYGSNLQSLVAEALATFFMMFVASAVATDARAVGELGAIAVGATVFLNTVFAGAISGASLNPARSLGPAIVTGSYAGLWIYFLGPVVGSLLGTLMYSFLRTQEGVFPKVTRMPILVPNGSKAEKALVKRIIYGR